MPLKPGAYRFTCNVVAALQPHTAAERVRSAAVLRPFDESLGWFAAFPKENGVVSRILGLQIQGRATFENRLFTPCRDFFQQSGYRRSI